MKSEKSDNKDAAWVSSILVLSKEREMLDKLVKSTLRGSVDNNFKKSLAGYFEFTFKQV